MSKILIKDISREDWLELRKDGIGGSDASSIIGVNPFSSPYRVWADKTDRLEPQPDNEAMRQGRDLEEYVAERFCEATGKKVKRSNYMFISDDHPFMLADVDRLIVGEKAGLECKTTSSLSLKQFKGGEFPITYYCQCLHYMIVTGFKKWYLAVLVLGRDFYTFEIPFDEEDAQALIEAEKDFWENYVLTDQEPEVYGEKATTETIKSIYDGVDVNKEPIELEDTETLIDEFFRQSEIENTAKEEKEKIKQKIQLKMGENSQGYTNSYRVFWKPYSRRNFSEKLFQETYPGIDLTPFYKCAPYRKFEIKEKKN